MKQILFRTILFCALAYLPVVGASAQGHPPIKNNNSSLGPAILRGSGKTVLIVVQSAGKLAWGTTKFTAKHFAKPVFLKVAPTVARFSLKLAGKATKQAFRGGGKLSLAYLKTKLP